MLVEKQFLAQLRTRSVDLYADHQAASAHLFQSADLVQFGQKVVADLGGVFHQSVALDHLQHGDGRRTGQVTAAEGGSQQPRTRLEVGRYEHAADRESVGHAFGRGDQVGADAGGLVGEEAARAAVSRLDFVEHQLRPGLGRRGAHGAQELVRRAVDARNALNALDDHRRELPRGELRAHRPDVVQGGELHVRRAVEGRRDRRIVRHGDGSRRAAVEGLRDGERLRPARVERRQFQGVLVGLGPRVAEEKAVVVVTRDAAQSLRQLHLKRILDRVGVESQACDLLLHGPHVVGLRMPDRDHGMAAVKVEVLGSRRVVDVAALAPHRFDRI